MATGERTKIGDKMIQVVRGDSRGHFNHGWLDTYHTFSFGDYHDPARMGYRSLRVMNEDRIAAGMGFGTHPHRDMEILTYVLEGSLFHEDSLGHGGPIRPGELQRMTAGTGIYHSERNDSQTDPVHLYQIWLFPDRRSLKPGYEQKSFDEQARQGRWQLVASPDGRDGSLTIHQDAKLSLLKVTNGEHVSYELEEARHAWVQVLRGRVELDGIILKAGDGVTVEGNTLLTITSEGDSELLLFDLA